MYQIASSEPVWLELFPAAGKTKAVTAQFAPIGREAARAAKAAGRALLAEDANAAPRVAEAMAEVLIRHGLRGWTEIADASGKPLAFTPENVEIFLRDAGLFDAAYAAYAAPWLAKEAEKNGYAPSQTGTSGAQTPVKPIARAAAKPARTAPTKSTRPARRKAQTSGT